jgi:HD-GYP domain-containing protein (c-di-GMP phosphodiesterase class II)
MATESTQELTLAAPVAAALERLDRALKRDFDVSLALATIDGEVVYPDKASALLPADDVVRLLCSEVAADGAGDGIPRENVGAAYAVPVADGGKVLGALIGYSTNGRDALQAGAQDERLTALLAPIASMIADSSLKEIALGNLSDELAHKYEEVTLVYELVGSMEVKKGFHLELDSIFRTVIDRSDLDVLIVFQPRLKRRRMHCSPQLRKELTAENRAALYKMEAGVRAIVLQSGEPWVANELWKDDRFSHMARVCSHAMSVPIEVTRDEVGVMTVMRGAGKERFFMGDVTLISTIAKQIAIVIRNARLFSEVRSLFLNLVKSLISIVEAKHKYTKGHSERVHAISCYLGKKLGLKRHAREVLHWASLFHDVGKISVPDAILNKPGTLTEEEFAVIKRHPVVGSEVLSHIEQLHEALPAIRHHHERMDGSGYPDGLKGDEVPLAARIIAVADVYDALTSTRSYRPAMPVSKALELMREEEGRHFDPRVLRLFLEKHDEILQVLHSASSTAMAV